MRGAIFQYQKTHGHVGSKLAAVEAAKKEDAELRRARIMNKAEPSVRNVPWPDNIINGDPKN